MKVLNTQKVALTFGSFIGGWHLIWSILVLTGLAQPILNFVFWMHMILNPYRVATFTIKQSLILIIVTFVFGYVAGWVFAWLWNKAHK